MKFTQDIQDAIDNRVRVFTILYHEEGDAATRKALNCEVLIKSNHSNRCYALRRDDAFYCTDRAIDEEINKYIELIETYPGELSGHQYLMKEAAMAEIKNRVIDFYINKRAA